MWPEMGAEAANPFVPVGITNCDKRGGTQRLYVAMIGPSL
jgi:hypothetical protein